MKHPPCRALQATLPGCMSRAGKHPRSRCVGACPRSSGMPRVSCRIAGHTPYSSVGHAGASCRCTPPLTLPFTPAQIIKGGGQEIRHVMSPVHLLNATGGGQSVYAVKQLQRVTPSPSPSRGAKGTCDVDCIEGVMREGCLHPRRLLWHGPTWEPGMEIRGGCMDHISSGTPCLPPAFLLPLLWPPFSHLLF